MTTNDEQYVPSEALLRTAWSDYCQSMDACNAWVRPDGIDTRAEFDRFLARVRRDAAREALKHFRKTELAIIPLDADEDSPIRVRQQALAWRIEMHLLGNYPEETP